MVANEKKSIRQKDERRIKKEKYDLYSKSVTYDDPIKRPRAQFAD